MRLVIVGWGAIGRTTAKLLGGGPVELVAVALRAGSATPLDLPAGVVVITDPDELSELHVDVVAEAASRESVGPWGHGALRVGSDFIVSSVSALADVELFESLRQAASANGTRVHIHPGAIGGVDALSAARLLGLDSVEHRIIKPPRAWRGTPAETLCALDILDSAVAFFSASANEASELFPKNANAAMTTALAGVGPQATIVTLVADPAATTNRHEITASGAFGRFDILLAVNPSADNPKTSMLAALSLVRAIHNLAASIVI